MKNKLEHIDYEITKVCNLKCIHCSAEAGEGGNPDIKTIKKVLEEGKDLGLKRIGITGGEPFLFPKELSDVIDFSYNLGCQVHIHSNGQLVEDNLDLICDRVEKIENLTLTLMGYNATHDANTGQAGAYDRLKNLARKITKSSLPLMMFFIPMSNNYRDISKSIADFYQKGVRKFRIMGLAPGGRAKESYDTLQLGEEQVQELLIDLKTLEKKGLELEAGFCTRLIYPELKPLKYHPSCMSGVNRLHINAEGYVFPCTASSGFLEMNVGNIHEQSLEAIWTNSEKLNKFRKFYKGYCRVQKHYEKNC